MLSLHYNRSNSFLFVNAVKMHKFKVKDSGIKPYTLWLSNISKDFTIDNMKKSGLKGYVHAFLLIIIFLILTTFYIFINK